MFLQNPLFEKYLTLLLKWNKTYNLTAIIDPKEIRIKHFEDSLAPLPFLSKNSRLLDIGTGAGFPGIPLKLARPDLEVVLLDSQRKKVIFCEAVIRELKLNQIEVAGGRAEDSKMIEKLGKFDVIISRATFSVKDFLAIALSYTKTTSTAIAMKGPNWEKEETSFLEWKRKAIKNYQLNAGLGGRTLLIFSRQNFPVSRRS